MRTREEFEKLINEGKSQTDISKELGISQTTVRYWLKKFKLETCSLTLLKNRFKFKDEFLLKVWNESETVNQFLLNLGVNPSGGAWYHYQKRLNSLGIDIKGRTESGQSRGGKNTAIQKNEKSTAQRKRLPRSGLKKLMNLNSVSYCCRKCQISEWMGEKMILQIHHIDHDKTNNKIENLEYLCPNCHSINHHQEKS